MVRIAEVVEEGRPLPAARCHMPRRYVGLGTAARGTVVIVGYDHACRSIATARDSIHYRRLRPPQPPSITRIHRSLLWTPTWSRETVSPHSACMADAQIAGTAATMATGT